jgi:hypothetical protein
MKIELYLKQINQEMIDAGRVARPGAEWTVSWPKECCVLDFSLAPHEDLVQPARPGFMLRKEDEGGMFWDPRTGAVYKVDEEAYHALLDLDRGFSELDVARRLKVPAKEVNALTRQLARIRAGETK